MFFLEASFTEEFIYLYTYLLNNNHPILILDNKIKKDDLYNLTNKFKPDYILINSSDIKNTKYLKNKCLKNYNLFVFFHLKAHKY